MEEAVLVKIIEPNCSSILGSRENGYGVMRWVEETLASYLSPDPVSSLKALTLPTKPCLITSALVGKAYMAGACLHNMCIGEEVLLLCTNL